MKNPTTLRDTRMLLGLSQRVFAPLLGISRSQLAMAESGQRQLPATASLRLLQLQQELIQHQTTSSACEPGSSEARLPNLLDSRVGELANRCRKEAIRCRQLARTLQQENERTVQQRIALPLLSALVQHRPAAEQERLLRPFRAHPFTQPQPAVEMQRVLEAAVKLDEIARLLGYQGDPLR